MKNDFKKLRDSCMLAESLDVEICRRCFQAAHHRKECDEISIVACTDCYRQNYFTTSCICKNKLNVAQTLRMCGMPLGRIFIDVNVLTKNIPALINTSIIKSRVDPYLCNFIQDISAFTENKKWMSSAQGVNVYMDLYNGTEFSLLCDVMPLSEGIHIHLGMDFLLKVNAQFSFDAINLDMCNNMATTHQDEVMFAFNHNKGHHLKNKLEDLGYELPPNYRRTPFTDGRKQFFSKFRDEDYVRNRHRD